MRLLRGWQPEGTGTKPSTRNQEHLDVRRRQATAEMVSIARCPRCGGELVARIARGEPSFWCRCPVRRGLACEVA